MNNYIQMLLDNLVIELNDTLAMLYRVISELEALQQKYPELSELLQDEKEEFEGRAARVEALKSDVLELKKKFSDPTRASGIIFYNEKKEEITNMDLSIDKNQVASIKIVDKGGNDAKVDGVPAWELSDPSLASLDVAADGMSAKIIPSGPLGAAKLSVKADADLGSGVEELSASIDLAFLAGKAVGILLSVVEAPSEA